MDRRTVIKGMAGAAALPFVAGSTLPAAAATAGGRRLPRVRPGDAGWPTAAEWDRLRAAVGGRLVDVTSPVADCSGDADSASCTATLKDLQNPFYIQDQPGATQTVGWVDAWTTKPSVYAVAAESVADVVAAVNFAREKNLRLVVKGGGHSYLGQSNAPDSLLLWTRGMRRLNWHDAFVPRGLEGKSEPVQAVTVEAGAKFLHLYDFVTTQRGRYVQGGGCTSVGIGGHVPTGGFGSFSRAFGTSAGGLIEAEAVTAAGRVLTVNEANHPDLYFALRGGGGAFCVLTRLTLRTHDLPETFGFVGQTITAKNEAGFRRLTAAFLAFAKETLVDSHWGEQAGFSPDDSLSLAMTFQGLSADEVRAKWKPFWDWLAANREVLKEVGEPRVVTMPARHWWDFEYRKKHYPGSIVVDDRPGVQPGAFWWAGNQSEVGIFLTGYDSAWLPESQLADGKRGGMATALVDASRHATVTLHFNKGLAGAPGWVRDQARGMAIHPSAADTFALAIVALGQEKTYPGVQGHEPDVAKGRRDAERVKKAMAVLRTVAPDTGSYCSEASYFTPDWQERSWGPNYARLLAAKQKYDPTGLFYGHHWVGSEFWSRDGFRPKR